MKLTDLLKFKKWIFDEYPNINIEQLSDYDILDYHQKKQLALCNVVGRSEQLKAVEKLKDFAYEVCPLHREDDLREIIGSL